MAARRLGAEVERRAFGAFAPAGVGARFVEALADAAGRGVRVEVQIDG